MNLKKKQWCKTNDVSSCNTLQPEYFFRWGNCVCYWIFVWILFLTLFTSRECRRKLRIWAFRMATDRNSRKVCSLYSSQYDSDRRAGQSLRRDVSAPKSACLCRSCSITKKGIKTVCHFLERKIEILRKKKTWRNASRSAWCCCNRNRICKLC